MRVYIRHGLKKYGNGKCSNKKFDSPLAKGQKGNIIETLINLIRKTGIPKLIICSPFKRCRQTALKMKYYMKKQLTFLNRVNETPKIVSNYLLSEYLGNQVKHKPCRNDFYKNTFKHDPPIYETIKELKSRVKQHDILVKQYDCNKRAIWFITHGIFIQKLMEIRKLIGSETNELDSFVIAGSKGRSNKYYYIQSKQEEIEIKRKT